MLANSSAAIIQNDSNKLCVSRFGDCFVLDAYVEKMTGCLLRWIHNG